MKQSEETANISFQSCFLMNVLTVVISFDIILTNSLHGQLE